MDVDVAEDGGALAGGVNSLSFALLNLPPTTVNGSIKLSDESDFSFGVIALIITGGNVIFSRVLTSIFLFSNS